jgi:molybdopterin-containing oxidoreductase family iron-sulfur binding subunit
MSEKINRRDFIRKALIAGAATTAAISGSAAIIKSIADGVQAESDSKKPKRKRNWAMIIDLDKCDGCRQCTIACQDPHFVPFDQEWIKIYEVEDAVGEKFFFPRPCMSCNKAPCVKVCPVGANFYNEDDIVLVDHERCIGCRMCMAACPYEVRYFNWEEPEHTEEELAHEYSPEEPWPHRRGVVEKCMLCSPHRSDMGELPYCVIACPKGTLYFGDLEEDAVSNGKETLSASNVFKDRQPYRYKEELGTKPKVYYLPRR